MKKQLLIKIMNISLLVIGINSGCKKFVDIPPPKNQIVSETAFADDASAIATVNGIYSKMMGSGVFPTASSMTIYPGMSADELTYFSSTDRDEFIQNHITNANDLVLEEYFWNPSYTLIYEANNCIEGADNSKTLSTATRNMIKGEALFVRALINFYLVNLFNRVPLVVTTDYNVSKDQGQQSPDVVYKQIITDLTDAIKILPDNYPSIGRARPNKAVAEAFLSRVYLYSKDYQGALNMANLVIGDSRYKLESDLNAVFLSTSQEAIWQLAPVSANYNTWDASYFLPTSATSVPAYTVAKALLSSFEPSDKRLSNWIGTRIYKGSPVYYPYKYKIGKGATSVTEYNMVIRLAEIYLIRAEAKAMTGDLSGADQDMNLVRARAGLIAQHSVDQQSSLAAIQHERQVELCFEWGHRWFDLKRTNTIDQVLSSEKPGWTSNAALYPIPYSQILINTKLTQNAGY